MLNLGSRGAESAAPADLVKEGTDASFMADVIQASREVAVIVDFQAEWCGPCKTLGPAIEKAVKEAGGSPWGASGMRQWRSRNASSASVIGPGPAEPPPGGPEAPSTVRANPASSMGRQSRLTEPRVARGRPVARPAPTIVRPGGGTLKRLISGQIAVPEASRIPVGLPDFKSGVRL